MRIAYFSSALAMVAATFAVGWVVGTRLLRVVVGTRTPGAAGLPERALAAIVGAVALAVCLLVLNAAAAGNVFGNPIVVPVVAAGLVVVGVRGGSWPRSIPWGKVAVALLVLAALFVLPAIRAGSGLRTGDTPWHLGWTEQLLAGEIVPTGFAPELARNAYPWGFHALLATMVRLVPGSDPLVAHEALHVLIVIGIPLAAACLARRLDRRAGWAAAAAVALIGGWGWIAAGEPDFVLSPSLAHYGADLVVASPNSMYELFPPVLPRELGLVLLGGAGVLMALRTEEPGIRHAVAGGVVVGLAGLVSLPMFVTGLLWIVAATLASRRGRRLPLFGSMLLPAVAVLALWALPVAAQYVAYGGFVDITPRLGVEWEVGSALWSWGLLLPLSAVGAVMSLRSQSTDATRTLLAFTIATLVFLALALQRAQFGWNPFGSATLLHQGRVWPVAHLLAAVFAGVAVYEGWARLRRRSGVVAVAGVSLVFGLGTISPVFASMKLTEWIRIHERGYLYNRADLRGESFVPRAAEYLSSGDIVRVEGSDFLGFLLWQMSGARLATYDDDRLANNDARIRFRELAEQWDEVMARGGFDADYLVMRAGEAPDDARVVLKGWFRDEDWVLIPATP